jgi:1-deoxy-D-xylulose-5-phosphate reductoisomerase
MISLIGSTGSIGRQALGVMEHLGIRPVALAAGRDAALLERQCRRYNPKLAVLDDEAAASGLRVRLADTPVRVEGGAEAVCAAAAHPDAAASLIAATGLAGLKPALAAVEAGRRVALANKESLVCAGALVMSRVRACKAELLPVDSELSAIFQCLQGVSKADVKRVILTASGGPFFGYGADALQKVTVAETLAHPTWKMGPKITVDCATLLNKGYEFWEALYFFGLTPDRITVAVHRESVVHSLIELTDGSLLAQLGTPDMRTAIQYALTYPGRKPCPAEPLDLFAKPLTFAPPDTEAFPCLALAIEAARHGGLAGAVLAGAGEAAVERFIAGTLTFTSIARCVEKALKHIPPGDPMSLDDILAADRAAREIVYGS